jgi:hypothetical protein
VRRRFFFLVLLRRPSRLPQDSCRALSSVSHALLYSLHPLPCRTIQICCLFLPNPNSPPFRPPLLTSEEIAERRQKRGRSKRSENKEEKCGRDTRFRERKASELLSRYAFSSTSNSSPPLGAALWTSVVHLTTEISRPRRSSPSSRNSSLHQPASPASSPP